MLVIFWLDDAFMSETTTNSMILRESLNRWRIHVPIDRSVYESFRELCSMLLQFSVHVYEQQLQSSIVVNKL